MRILQNFFHFAVNSCKIFTNFPPISITVEMQHSSAPIFFVQIQFSRPRRGLQTRFPAVGWELDRWIPQEECLYSMCGPQGYPGNGGPVGTGVD